MMVTTKNWRWDQNSLYELEIDDVTGQESYIHVWKGTAKNMNEAIKKYYRELYNEE